MATRSTIAIQLSTGEIKKVYCHWDGYIAHNGAILNEHYTDAAKIEELINEGAISVLGPEIGTKHDFSETVVTGTKFYARDRGDTLKIDTYQSMSEYRLSSNEDYNYLFANGTWKVSMNDKRNFIELEDILN